MNILITGAGGQLGRRIAEFLHSNGHSIITLGRYSVSPNFKNYSWSLGMSPNPEAFENLDCIFHLAWSRNEAEKKSLHLNVGGSSKIFEAARLSNVKLINFSSFSAICPISNYGRAKRMVEQINTDGTNFRIAKVEMDFETKLFLFSNRLLKKIIYLPVPRKVNVHVIEIESLLEEVLRSLDREFSDQTITLPFQTLTVSEYLSRYYGLRSFTLPKILFHLILQCLRIGNTKIGLLMNDRWISLISSSHLFVTESNLFEAGHDI
jgi:dTDP-4-dehydrorhamnose reductase